MSQWLLFKGFSLGWVQSGKRGVEKGYVHHRVLILVVSIHREKEHATSHCTFSPIIRHKVLLMPIFITSAFGRGY